MSKIQVALDVLSIADAITLGEEVAKGGVDWLEVGTPLIKNHGMQAVKTIKKTFPNLTVIADMKTMDTGDLEVEIAAKNGADVVAILGLADEFTVKRAVTQARGHGVRIMADLIGVKDKVKAARKLERLGVDYIIVHTPIDIQKVKLEKVDNSLEEIKKLKASVKIPVAAAGGVNLETISYLKDAGADIFIIGRAITKAKDVTGTTKKFMETIGAKAHLVDSKPEQNISSVEMVRQYEMIPTPFISDAMKRFGAMRGLRPIVLGKRICGKAYTVKTLSGDWGKVVKAVDLAEKGDIIVVDAQGMEIAVWGELATLSAMSRGIKGVIIDGAARDSDDIKKLGFPLWSRFITPNAGQPHGHGELNGEISCGGQKVSPGDIIVADEVGVIVVEKVRAREILEKAKEISLMEKRYKAEIKKGKTLSEIFGL